MEEWSSSPVKAADAFKGQAILRAISPKRVTKCPSVFRENRVSPCLLFLVQCTAIEASLQTGMAMRESLSIFWPINLAHPGPTGGLAFALLILPIVYWLGGLTPGYGVNRFERLQRQAKLTLLVFLSFFIWDYLVLNNHWSRGVLIGTMVWSLLLVPVCEGLLRSVLIKLGQWGTPALVIGGGEMMHQVVRNLRTEPAFGLVPVGILEENYSLHGSVIDGVPILGSPMAAPAYQDMARVVLVVGSQKNERQLADLLQDLPFRRLHIIPDLQGLQSLWVTAHDLRGILMLEFKCNLRLRHNRVLKRVLDASVAAFLLLLSAPLIAACALWVKQASPGPVFYSQTREGLNGRRIRVHKLRTMYVDAEARLATLLEQNPESLREWSTFMKLKNDPRILPGLGTFIRKYSIDELPQFWNVLCGQMSLVGPRPFPPYHLERFDAAFRQLRRTVPPGVTGLWQISARSASDLNMQEALDTYYIRNWSPWMDADILVRTLNAVLMARGAA